MLLLVANSTEVCTENTFSVPQNMLWVERIWSKWSEVKEMGRRSLSQDILESAIEMLAWAPLLFQLLPWSGDKGLRKAHVMWVPPLILHPDATPCLLDVDAYSNFGSLWGLYSPCVDDVRSYKTAIAATESSVSHTVPGMKGGMCNAGVSFLLGFFWSDSTFRVACTFFPFLGFFFRSQSLMNWSERSSGFKEEMDSKRKRSNRSRVTTGWSFNHIWR